MSRLLIVTEKLLSGSSYQSVELADTRIMISHALARLLEIIKEKQTLSWCVTNRLR